MAEQIEVTSAPIAIDVVETVTALCEDMRKLHLRLRHADLERAKHGEPTFYLNECNLER